MSFFFLKKDQEQHQRVSQLKPSFVDTSPIFEDLNASFKRLYKSILNNRELFESGFNSNINNSIKTEPNLPSQSPSFKSNEANAHSLTPFQVKHSNLNETTHQQANILAPSGLNPFAEPTLNTLNSTDFNTSFDTFMQSIRIASNGEINWNLNDIDTSQFKCKKVYFLMSWVPFFLFCLKGLFKISFSRKYTHKRSKQLEFKSESVCKFCLISVQFLRPVRHHE